MTKPWILLAGLLLAAGHPGRAADDPPRPGARINNLKVLSDKIDDVTTAESILKSFIKPGMSQQDRSRAIWTAIVKYRHQTIPPNEFLASDWEAHDPVKIFNVYGYCMCCCTSALNEALNRLDGREARGRILNGHSVPEIRYDDGWHMFDSSLITYFPKPRNQQAASVDEIADSITSWYANHPGYRKNAAKVFNLMRSDGWMGWKTQGPELLAQCPFYKMGYLPARTHGWDATLAEYDRKSEIYEYGYQVGHRALFSLRPGESYTRDAGNRGLHVNQDTMPNWDMLQARAPANDLIYVNDFFPGYRGGVVGNGTHRYAPNLAAGDLARGAEAIENLASGGSPALHSEEPGGAFSVVPMVSPYVYLGGSLALKAKRGAAGDRVAVSLSTNNGRTFKTVWTADRIGSTEAKIDLSPLILRRYAYWLKLEVETKSPGSAGFDQLVIDNDIQHAPRTLPWIGKGATKIVVDADGDRTLATRSIVGKIPEGNDRDAKNETAPQLGVSVDNVRNEYGGYWWKGGTGTVTVPIEVPGEIALLRFSVQARARGPRDAVRMLVSTDDGTTWKETGRITGPTQGRTAAFRVSDWARGQTRALLRFELAGNNTIGVLSFRVDVDYRDPLAAPALQPFLVVHRWKEAGRERSHAERITRLPTSYTIEASDEPEMISVVYEMPSTR